MTSDTKINPFKPLKNVHLSESEKKSLLAGVRGFMAVHGPDRQPWYGWFVSHAVVTVGIIALLGSSVTGALAHWSQPDELLYPVKVSVNDRIEVALAGDENDRLDKELEQLERMMAAEESLADRELDPEQFPEQEDDTERMERGADDDEKDDEGEKNGQRADISDDDGTVREFEKELESFEREMREMEHEADELFR